MEYKNGDIVYGIITSIIGYGAFVDIGEYTGLIHISEFSDSYVKNIRDFVKIGDKVKLRIVEIDENSKRMKLSYKSLNKTRGVRVEVPKYTLGFKTLHDYLPQFIQEQLKKEKEEDNEGC